MTDAAVATEEAPVIASEEEEAPAASAPSTSDAYQSYEFPFPDETPDSADAPPSETKDDAAPDGDSDDLPDELIERVLGHEKAKARVDQLTNNRYGNRLQQERAERERLAAELQAIRDAEATEKAFKEASDFYEKLNTDEAFYDAKVAEVGEGALLRWIADYKDTAASRKAGAGSPSVDIDAVRREYDQAFNATAISQFKDIAKATLPFYGELPEETRATIDKLAYDPAGNWFADALQSLGTGMQKHLESLERRHKDALAEARLAGRNEAIAARESGSPVVVEGSVGTDPTDIIRRYAAGDSTVSRADFQKARRALGQDY